MGLLPNETRVHVRIENVDEECDGYIAESEWGNASESWIYRIEVTSGGPLKDFREDNGELWVNEGEMTVV